MYIPFGSMIEMQSLAQFPVNHLSFPPCHAYSYIILGLICYIFRLYRWPSHFHFHTVYIWGSAHFHIFWPLYSWCDSFYLFRFSIHSHVHDNLSTISPISLLKCLLLFFFSSLISIVYSFLVRCVCGGGCN